MSTDLSLNNLKENSIAVNYLWNASTHYLRAGIDNKRNLYILEHLEFPVKSFPELIISEISKHKRHKIYMNVFEPIKETLGGKCKQYSEDLVINLDIFYEILHESNRIYVLEGLNLPSKDKNFILCMSFLLKGLLGKLCNSKQGTLNFPSDTPDTPDISPCPNFLNFY